MTKICTIHHLPSGRVLVTRARWCDTFGSKLRGFMFKGSLAEDEGLVLVDRRDNKVNTSIHMFFVNFPLGVLWVNDAGRVVDQVVARPWRPSYTPQAPARYVVEMHPSRLDGISIGDPIDFIFASTNDPQPPTPK